jgi:phosphate transport system protein
VEELDPAQAIVATLIVEQCHGARELLRDACSLLQRDAAEDAAAAIAADDELDAGCAAALRAVELALAAGPATLVHVQTAFALLRIIDHVERIGDYGVTIAKLVLLCADLPKDPLVVYALALAAADVDAMFETAIGCLVDLDPVAAESLVVADQAVNTANRVIVKQLLDVGADSRLREWAMRMVLVARCLERAGDHLVDVGEQVAWVATGQLREFTDASSPRSARLRTRRQGALDSPPLP